MLLYMNRLPKPAFFLFLLAFFLFSPLKTWSRHIVGGELSYRYLSTQISGEKRYAFTLNLYRDCFGGGAAFDDPAQLAIYRGAWDQAVLVSAFEVTVDSIEKLNYGANCMDATFNLCLEKGSYKFERLLQPTDDSYFIIYQRCCLTQTLSNIINPGEVGSTFMVELTAMAMYENNSSPELPDWPTTALCIHQPVNLSQSATDPDGDKLEYRFAAPYSGGGSALQPPSLYACDGAIPTPPCGPPYAECPFIEPEYSPQAPLAGDPVVQIDSVTGLITGIPRRIGQYLAAIEYREYRDSFLLSAVRRTIIFNVVDNPIPTVDRPAAISSFQLRPNPATDWVDWDVSLNLVEIRVVDLLGRQLKKVQGMATAGMHIQDLKAGYYQVLAVDREGKAWVCPLAIVR